MIEIKQLTKTIRHKTILNNISINLTDSTIVGFQGVNGSGKTMLIRAIAGLIKPTKGSIVIDGKKLGKDIPFPQSVGALIENPAFLNEYTGFDNLKMLASLKRKIGNQEIKDAIKSVGLDPDDDRKYKAYSLGMKQRLGIAAAIMEHPKLVLLDEPTNALDEAGVDMLARLLLEQKERGTTVVVASHDRYFLESIADIIYKFEEGKVIGSYLGNAGQGQVRNE